MKTDYHYSFLSHIYPNYRPSLLYYSRDTLVPPHIVCYVLKNTQYEEELKCPDHNTSMRVDKPEFLYVGRGMRVSLSIICYVLYYTTNFLRIYIYIFCGINEFAVGAIFWTPLWPWRLGCRVLGRSWAGPGQ